MYASAIKLSPRFTKDFSDFWNVDAKSIFMRGSKAMTSYSKEVIRDLAAGTLPWPQTRRIMSAYKDDDRFFKIVAVYQDRVAWKDPILLPVSDHLFICQSGDERVTRCECGHSFGDYRKNWKLNAAINVRNTEEALREIYPNSDLPDPQWMEIREFICPDAAPCTRSRRPRRVIRSCMISSPISKASIATGWANRSRED